MKQEQQIKKIFFLLNVCYKKTIFSYELNVIKNKLKLPKIFNNYHYNLIPKVC